METKTAGRGSFILSNLVLGVSAKPTPDDIEAQRVIEELIAEVDPSVPLEIVPQESGRTTPWLHFSESTVYGLEDIKDLAMQERLFQGIVVKTSEGIQRVSDLSTDIRKAS